MALQPLIRQLATQLLTDFCAQRTPPDVRDHVRVEFVITGTKARTWALFAFNRNSQRMPYQRTSPTADLTALIAEVESDPTHVFWG